MSLRNKSLIALLSGSLGFLAGFFATISLFEFQFSAGFAGPIVTGICLTALLVGLVVRGALL